MAAGPVPGLQLRLDARRDERGVRDGELELVRDDRLLDVTAQQLDLARCVVRDPERPHLARGVQVGERARDLLGLDEGVGAVQQQDVEVVGAQGLERALDGRDEVLVREVEVRALGHDAGLGLDDPLRTLGGGEVERLGEATLAAVELGAVHVGVVEERDAGWLF